MLGGKKGLSDIVTNVLIILLVLVAVGIIWYFVQPFIREGVSGITTEAYTVSVGIQSRSVVVDSQNVSFQVSRAAGKGDLVAFIVVVTDNAGGSKAVRVNRSLGELEVTSVVIDYVALGLSSVKQVAIVPIIADQTGREQNGQQSAPEFPANSTTTGNNNNNSGGCTSNQACITGGYAGTQTCTSGVLGPCLTTLSCGDGIKSTPPEACEWKNNNNFYGASCDYGALFGSPGSQFGNQTCTSSCNTNSSCFCFADLNGDGFLSADYDDFVDAYTNTGNPLYGTMRIDCNHNGVVTYADDWNCYQAIFDAGTCN